MPIPITILINNYNYGRFLRAAIDSALGQSYANKEVIVVDDGSTDASREILSSYGDRVIPVLKKNGGQASALNAGFEASSGDLICLLDSDDVWLPSKIQVVVEAALQDPGAIMIYHKVQPVRTDLTICRKVIPTGVFRGDIAAKIRKSGGWWACPPTSALCFRRAALRRMGPIPEEEFRICADAFLSYVVPFLGPVIGLQNCLALYRQHESNHFTNPRILSRSRDSEMLQSHLRRYERVVASANRRLGELGTGIGLNLEDHWSYQVQKYHLRAAGCRSIVRVAWDALRFPGEPAAINRVKMAAHAVLRSLPSNKRHSI